MHHDRRIQIIVAMLIVATASMTAAAGKFVFAGGQKSIWIGRFDQKSKAFQIVARSLGEGKWKWIDRECPGVPSRTAVVADRLHLLFPPDQNMFYRLGEKPQLLSARDFPGTTMAICGAPSGFNGSSPPTLVSVSSSRAGSIGPARSATRPSSRPTGAGEKATTLPTSSSRPAQRVRLIVHQLVGNKWQAVGGPSPELSIPSTARVLAVALDRALYVFVRTEGTPPDLRKTMFAMRGKTWKRMNLPAAIATSRILAVAPSGGKLLLFLRSKTASIKTASVPAGFAQASFSVVVLDPADMTVVRHAVHPPEKVKGWTSGSALHVTRFENGFALIWRGANRDDFLFAKCDRDGKVSGPEALKIFSNPPTNDEAQKIIDAFMWGVLLAVFVPMLVLKPKSPPKPFTLPPGLRPGSILRRLAAGAFDFIPFSLLGAALFLPEAFEQHNFSSFQGASDYYNRFAQSSAGAYMLIFTMLTYAAYGIFMEMRFQATLGKMIFKLRVVADDGQRCGLREVSIRNIVRIMELLWLILLPLFVLIMAMTRNRQRPGDILARTTVIDARSKPLPPLPPIDEEGSQDGDGGVNHTDDGKS